MVQVIAPSHKFVFVSKKSSAGTHLAFSYYISPDVGAWAKAAELVCTAEEAHMVEVAKTGAERFQRIATAVEHGDLQLARSLGWDGMTPPAPIAENKSCLSKCTNTKVRMISPYGVTGW